MGGAGAGLPVDVIGALHANPALLTQFDNIRVEISAEAFADDLSMTTPRAGSPNPETDRVTTDSDGELGILPALGWSYHKPGSKVAYGWGLLAIAGFRTNWPPDPANTLIQPQPIGFGQLQTELAVSKIPFALAWQVNDKLSLGASLNLYLSRLSIQPLPVVLQDCTDTAGNFTTVPNTLGDNCYRPDVSVPTSEFALSLQVGLYYEFDPKWSLGFSYTTSQDYSPFTWQSARANPDI
ncbi:MAG: outer membrane protein transport protein, partial [Acidobacteriota bacterium]